MFICAGGLTSLDWGVLPGASCAVQITGVMVDINTPTTLSGDSSKVWKTLFRQLMKTAWWLGDVGPIGYGFEPVRINSDSDQNSSTDLGSTSTGRQIEDDGDPNIRLGNSDWCFCTQCCPRMVESFYCKEILALEDKLCNAEDAAKDCSCITQSLRIYWICLGSEALNVALLTMADARADTLVRPISSRLLLVCGNVAPDSFFG